jgi:hypothetical protein
MGSHPATIQLVRSRFSTMPAHARATYGDLEYLPTTFAIGFTLQGVIIRVRELPPHPRPVSIQGAPLCITTDPYGTGWGNWAGIASPGGAAHTLTGIDLKNMTSLTRGACDSIARYCVEHRIPLHAVRLLYSPVLMCVLSRDHPTIALPKTFGGRPCMWKVKEAPTSLAVRNKVPQASSPDNSSYLPTLRPGVIVSSKDPGSADPASGMTTTMGISLECQTTHRQFVTVAEHRFFTDQQVYHLGGTKRQVVGHIHGAMEDTDIALAMLKPGVRHTNELFEVNGISFRPTAIEPEFVPMGTLIEIDSPFDGVVGGIATADEMMMIPDVEHIEVGAEWRWVAGRWMAMSAQSGNELKQGSCGVPVITQDTGTVMGFVRYHDYSSHQTYAIAASNLGKGWKVL